MNSSKPRLVPSMVALLVIVYSFLMFTTVTAFFNKWPQVLHRTMEMRKDTTPMGDDFKVVFLAVGQFLNHKPVYYTIAGRHPNYDHIPQSLVLMLPFCFFSLQAGYFSLIIFSFVSLFMIYLYAVFRFSREWFYVHLLFFPCAMLLSQAGILLLNRGNMGAIATVFIFLGFVFLRSGKMMLVALMIALATCIKLAYAPLVVLLFLHPKRVKLVACFILVHLAVLASVVIFHQSTWIIRGYFVELGNAFEWMRDWYGDANIALVSLLSEYIPWHAAILMTSGAGVVVFVGLLIPIAVIMIMKRLPVTRMNVNEKLILYGLLTYITVLGRLKSNKG